MATTPQFAATPRPPDIAQISVANANRDGTGTIATVATGAAAPGTRVDEIIFQAIGNASAGMIRLYLSTDGGATWRLYDEIPVAAVTPSSFVAAWRTVRRPVNLDLANANCRLGASTHIAEAFNVIALASNYA